MHIHAMNIPPLQLHGALAALAAPKRFDLLVQMLAGEERSVSQLAEAVGLSQSCTTRHLQALARAGLARGVRDGKRVVFRISPRDDAARAVLASIAGGAGSPSGPESDEPGLPMRRRKPRRRPASSRAREARRRLLDAAVRIESTAELEPLVVDQPPVWDEPEAPERPAPESDRTSAPQAAPAWRRSDLEDFLL
jgi:DNA-binding transcriptional ArsR family regulator